MVSPAMGDDPNLWLEEVEGDEALSWVRERNEKSKSELEAHAGFETLRTDLLAILNSNERIPYVGKHGEHFYNFWQDANNARGIWRRTTRDEYAKPEPQWDVLLDVDELNKAEGEDWVWHGVTYLRPPEGEPYRHVLISLSH